MTTRLFGIVVATGALLAPLATGDVVSITPDRDNTIYSESVDLANGIGQHLFAGRTAGGSLRRALMRFDIAGQIPAGAVITDVSLRLEMSRNASGSSDTSLHRVAADWGEGNSDAPGNEGTGAIAAQDDATWKYRFYDPEAPAFSPAWSTLGGDYDATPSASENVLTFTGPFFWDSTPKLVSDVQTWLDDPADNFGWILIGREDIQSAKRFESSENGTTTVRPMLTVTFNVTTGACCLPGECQILSSAACASAGGSYQGDGIDCAVNPCALPEGGCCVPDGTCVLATSQNCASLTGAYQGDGTDCATVTCPDPVGACCMNDTTCDQQTEPDCVSMGGTYQGPLTDCQSVICELILEKFVDPLPTPSVHVPDAGTTNQYTVSLEEVAQKLHRDLPPTVVWGYNGVFPGPTFETRAGEPIQVTWNSNLSDLDTGVLRTTHYLEVDTCLHGPHHAGAAPLTVVHLHGGHVPAEFDGDPEDTIMPGETQVFQYPNNQDAATIWYHDHGLGITRLNVYMGLAGFYIIRDDNEDALGLPSGDYEIPIVVQDRNLADDGSLIYPADWVPMYLGEYPVVNGKVWPFKEVEQARYRFRLLNGSGTRTYRFALSNGMPFTVIGNDGGLLTAPVVMNEIIMAPAERADVIVDFSSFAPGSEIILTNDAPAPWPNGGGQAIGEIMKFVVTGDTGPTPSVPAALRTIDPIPESESIVTRDLVITRESTGPECNPDWWVINGLAWDDIVERPRLGTTEIWRFVNPSNMMHPMHMHLVFFQVLDRDGFTLDGETVIPDGNPVPPAPEEMGWKDTVRVNPGEMVRVIARFEDYLGFFPYHCHILEHEDHEMMRQFEVIPCSPCEFGGDPSVVDVGDLLTFLNEWFPLRPTADYNGDGITNVIDLLAFLECWFEARLGAPCP